MPPKSKYTKEQVINLALNIVSTKGIDYLTAKELSHALKMSTSPIFTLFTSMQDLVNDVKEEAMKRFEKYVNVVSNDKPLFKNIGMQTLLFAKKEPHLYQFLFMSSGNSVDSLDDLFTLLGPVANQAISAIESDYHLSIDKARLLFHHVWIYTHGIATLCATGVCCFSKDEMSHMLSQDFQAMVSYLSTLEETYNHEENFQKGNNKK